MSILGSAAGLILLLLRRIKKIPRRIVYTLWIVPLIRFVIPFGVPFEYSVAELLKDTTGRIVTVRPDHVLFEGSTMMNAVGVAHDYFPITYKTERLRIIFEWANLAWIVVAAIIVLLVAVAYVLTMRSVNKCTRVRDNFYVSDGVGGPTVFGIVRPKIVFPSGADVDESRFALLHEMVHVRRLDNLWRLVAVTVCAVHWFNPFVWIFLKYFLTDMEHSADEAVLRRLDEAERTEYARSLVDYAARGSVLTSAFGGAGLRGRIENILSYKKMTAFAAVCVILLSLLVAVVLITNAI
ncbi:MAG: M56 family metallopeptidase [Clostridia bacterium]|nr:M56 family metallopeptidase [Clostridia bacterium]